MLSVLHRILASRGRSRIECHPRTLSPIATDESAHLYDDMQHVRVKLEGQLDSGQRSDALSCLVYQSVVDDLLDAYANALHAYYQRRCEDRVEIDV
jgi:hypothetical protein